MAASEFTSSHVIVIDMDSGDAAVAVATVASSSSLNNVAPSARSASSLSHASKRRKPIHVRKRYRKATSQLMFSMPRGKKVVGKRRKR